MTLVRRLCLVGGGGDDLDLARIGNIIGHVAAGEVDQEAARV